ncbi:MAG: hypothetical protein IJM51_10430, partial [Clostridia bacterium]|nr:hypothetical protein [Clostridia bacterium]
IDTLLKFMRCNVMLLIWAAIEITREIIYADSTLEESRFRPEYFTRNPEDTSVHVEHIYPILEDDFDEMANDQQEVVHQLRSRMSYMKKWGVAPDADAELLQIKKEETLFSDTFVSLDNSEFGMRNAELPE